MRKFLLTLLCLVISCVMGAQNGASNKITADLMNKIEESQNSNDLIRVIIVMNEQYDAAKTVNQMRYLNKSQKRDFVINELKRISNNSQIAIVNELQQGQRSMLVSDINRHWIVNGITCSMSKDMILDIAGRSDVAYLTLNYEVSIPDGEVNEPNIFYSKGENQWNVVMVNADDVWETGVTGNGVIVAVIDTGVNYNHNDITNNMWDGSSEGYPKHGYDFVNEDNDPMDDHSHGTHCAGTVSSYGTNGYQCGIAKDAKIMALKVLGSDGRGYTEWIINAMEFGVEHGAHVLSMSLGADGVGGESVYRVAMENVLESGVVASVAAGNTGDELYDYPVPYNVGAPGNCPSPWRNPDQTLVGGRSATVTVGATTNTDEYSYFSSIGPVTWTEGSYIGSYYDYPYVANSSVNIGLIKPDVSAPGSSIVSLYYGDNTGYSTKSGTSMATPCVAGVMALMLEANPMLTPVEIDSILEVTAVPLGGYTSKNNYFGAGRVDAQAAVATAAAMLVPGEVVVNPDTINMGYRPNNAWMAPKTIVLNNIGGAIEIQNIQVSDPYFQIDFGNVALPYNIGYHETLPVRITTGNSSNNGTPINAQLTVYYGDGQQTQAMVTATPYNPATRDVWETAYQVNTFPFTDSLVSSNIPLYNNYNLPPTNTEDGADAVYKLVFDQDINLNASLTSGENGKLILYREGFRGEGGPMENNSYTGPLNEDFSALFESQVGEGTSTWSYFPFYTWYDNSIAENLFLADELVAAGMKKSALHSLSWYATNAPGYLQQNLSIWLGNVTETTLNTGVSHLTSGMTLVYTGSCTPQIGWNEFEFNESDFVWDGVSNLLICVQRNNGSYNAIVDWQSHESGYYATTYIYRDGTSYDMSANTYGVNRSTTRPNIIFKGSSNEAGTSITNRTMSAGTYYLVTSSTSDAWGIEINTASLSCPEVASHPAPSDHNTDVRPMATQLKWRLGERTTEYQLLFGNDNENLETMVDWTRDLKESYIVTGLLNNTNYFWQILERNDGCPEGVEGPVWGFTTLLNGPQDLYAWNYDLYEGDDLTLEWTPLADTNILSYNIYQDNVLVGNTTDSYYTVSGLTYNMDGYNFYVTAVYAGGESNASETVTVFVSGNGAVEGHVYEVDGITGIANATVTFSGRDEFGYSRSISFTTDANGYYAGTLLAGNYSAKATCGGYQESRYNNVVNIAYNEITAGVDIVMDEVFYPVSEVVAEYYPDATDPNSPYVKVYWSVKSNWLYYDDGIFQTMIGTNGGQFYWGVMFPAGSYSGHSVTKVSMYDCDAHTGNIMIYQGGTTAPATLLYTQAYSCTGIGDFVEWTMNSPVAIDPSQSLWIVMCNDNGNYPASGCANSGDPNGRWISLNGATWEDVTDYNLDYTWMLRAYVSNGRGTTMLGCPSPVNHNMTTGNVTLLSDPNATPHFVGTPAQANGNNRSFDYYRVYRTDAYNNGPYTEDNTVLLADNVTDTLFIDVTWPDADAGIYKYGVSRVYEGNRGELVETPVTWANVENLMAFEPATVQGMENLTGFRTAPAQVHAGMNNRLLRGSVGYVDNIYGSVIPSGLCKLDMDNPQGATSLNPSLRLYAGEIVDGVIYGYTSDGYFVTFDPETGAQLSSVYAGTVIREMAYDYTSSTMYGSSTSDNNLYRIDLTNGSYTVVGTMSNVSAVAGLVCDLTGQLYAMAFTTGELYKVDKTTAAMTLVGNTGRTPAYVQSAAIDYATGICYWAHSDASYDDLYTVDLATAQATFVCSFVESCGLCFPYDANLIQGPRESPIVWSNTIDKNMNLGEGAVDVTVSLNSGDSPEGVTVSFTNLNQSEQSLYPIADVTLDATGYYAWNSFRKGDYQVQVSFDDYNTISENVSIWDATALNYVLSEINYGLSNLYVSRTGWVIWTDEQHGNTVPSLDVRDAFFVDFEDSRIPEDWTTIDADGDGYNWMLLTQKLTGTGNGHNGSNDGVLSQSYDKNYGGLYPDNYFVSPRCKIVDGSTFSFWACAQDASYGAEHFGVAISTTGNTSASDFTTIFEHTITSKGGRQGGERDMRDQSIWRQYAVDLSAYAGQQVYIAIRHFNCYDQFYLDVDDIQLTNGAKANRHFDSYQVELSDSEDNVIYQGAVSDCFMQLPVDDLIDGQTYHLKVASVYSSGLSEWSETDWAYQSCDNFEAVANLNMEMNDTANIISWSYPVLEERSIMTGGYPAYALRRWNGDNSNNPTGWYSFDLNSLEIINLINSNLSFYGGDYCPLDEYVHSINNSGDWFVINPETGEIIDQGYLGIVIRDCTWDYSSNKMYGTDGNYLYLWDIENNTYSKIGNFGTTIQVLACDLQGQLFGISYDEGALYRIDKLTGTSTYVGATGQGCYYYQSATFDHYTGKMYWTGINSYDIGFFAEVDTETGQATVLANNTGQQASFCVPFNGIDYVSPVTGVLGALLYRDGELLGFTSYNTYTDTIATGNHEYEVRVVYDGMKHSINFNAYYAMSCPTSIGGESYEVTVTANPAVGGTVTGSGNYINGFPCTVTATENDGFAFTGWTINGEVVATTPEYTFIVTNDVNIEGNFIGFTPHWTVVDNPNYQSTSLIGVLQINGIEQGANYLEVAALSGDECRGRQMMTYYPELNRYLIYMTILGMDNDQITFDMYDHMLGQETEYVCLNGFTFMTNETFGSTTDPFVIDFGVIQETAMQIGWNWYASAVEADGIEALEMLENSLGANGVMIKSQTEGFVMNYENYWVGNLNALSNDQMYMIKSDAQVNATLGGYLPDVTNHSITIYPSWTWLGYPSYNALDINDALEGFNAKDGDLLKAKQSFSSYVEGIGWMGSLQTLTPGQGMMYYSTRSVSTTLTYSGQGNRQELLPNITAENNHWVPNAYEYPENMSVMAVVEIDDTEIAEGNYELAAFDGNKCIGSAKIVFVEPMNRYVSFLTISGEEGSELQFGLYNGNTGEELFNKTDVVEFEPNAIIGSLDQPYVVNFRGMTGVSENYIAPRIYPNPVNKSEQFTIDITSSEADNMIIEIVDALGNTVSVNKSGNMPVMVTAPSAAGVYMIKIYVDGTEHYCRKLIVK